uniref:Uncharacterized protein n=1 Tax=viral metagenome TaxID=1070528 RepID=A0A6H1ZBT9_9ZZZZ
MEARCRICGFPVEDDLFAYVTDEKVCSICKLKYIGGLPTTTERINQARESLGLNAGEFLKQDNPKEAASILGRER